MVSALTFLIIMEFTYHLTQCKLLQVYTFCLRVYLQFPIEHRVTHMRFKQEKIWHKIHINSLNFLSQSITYKTNRAQSVWKKICRKVQPMYFYRHRDTLIQQTSEARRRHVTNAFNTYVVCQKSSCTALYFYFGPLRSVKIFRVFKTLTFRNILLSIFFNYLTQFRNMSLI